MFNSVAVIVTFNRKELLLKNIQMLIKQKSELDSIMIIDNASTDGTKDFLDEQLVFSNPKINYVQLSENIGGAGGFYEGVKRGFEFGYEWIWLMDDDGRPMDEDTFSIIIKKAIEIKQTGYDKILINSLVLCDNESLSFGIPGIKNKNDALLKAESGIIKNYINAFNGTLINKLLVAEVGYPNKDFFIKGDENDYLLRCKEKKAFVATVVESLYFHPVMPIEIHKLLGKNLNVTSESPWKEYYRTRNYTYMYMRHRHFITLFNFIIIRILSGLLSKKERFKKIRMIFKGFFDGIFKRMGKRVLP